MINLRNLAIAFGLFGLTVAGAKTYGVTLDQPYMVSGKQLQPGNYKVSLDGSSAIFRDSKGNTVEVKTDVKTGTRKFDYTAVESRKVNGIARLEGIEMQGTKMTLEFNR